MVPCPRVIFGEKSRKKLRHSANLVTIRVAKEKKILCNSSFSEDVFSSTLDNKGSEDARLLKVYRRRASVNVNYM